MSKIELIQAHKEDDTKRKKVRAMNKMTVAAALAALAVGAAAGWLAARAWREGNVETTNETAKPRRRALIRSSANADVQKRILENKIRYLEDCIAAAKVGTDSGEGAHSSDGIGGAPRSAEGNHETHAELVERLRKLPTEGERLTAWQRADDKAQELITVGEARQLIPRWAERSILSEKKLLENLDKSTELIGKRLGILCEFDLSGLNDEERKVHEDLMDRLAEFPDVFYTTLVAQLESTTMGEYSERIKKYLSFYRQGVDLETEEREILISQALRSFEVPEAEAKELRSTLDEVRNVISFGRFMRKD
ncbi:MAG: hypothetical protein IJG84_20440 [Kiritimatiellae bacterium]|nr:hypothetical protein [Kiritimatiellia bacterium]